MAEGRRIAAAAPVDVALAVTAQAQEAVVAHMRRRVAFRGALLLGLPTPGRTLWTRLKTPAGIHNQFSAYRSWCICHWWCSHIRCSESFSSDSSDMRSMSAASAPPAAVGAPSPEGGRLALPGRSLDKENKIRVAGICCMHTVPGLGHIPHLARGEAHADSTGPRTAPFRRTVSDHRTVRAHHTVGGRHIWGGHRTLVGLRWRGPAAG